MWKRKICGSICEVLFPIALIVIIALIRALNEATSEDAETFATESSNSVYLYPSMSDYSSYQLNKANLPFSSCFSQAVANISVLSYAVVTNDQNFPNYLYEKVQALVPWVNIPMYLNYSTEQQLNDYVTGPDYDSNGNRKICFGIIFLKSGENRYSLSLRYNITDSFPKAPRRIGDFLEIFDLDTHSAVDSLIRSPTSFHKQFYSYGFLSLNNIVDNYILTQILGKTNGKILSDVRPMRFPDYISDDFIAVVAFLLPFFIIITYLVAVCRSLSLIVGEKEDRTKEMMMMMGLSNSAY